MENKKVLVGGVAGILSGVAIMWLWNEIFDELWYNGMYWEEWLILIAMYAVPIIIGVQQGLLDESFWRVLLFPLLGGIVATIMALFVAIFVELWRSGDLLLAIVGTLLFMALTAPVSKVLVIFFE